MRHYVDLSTKNHHVDKDLFPLGSCTMKYNPKVNEEVAAMPGFAYRLDWTSRGDLVNYLRDAAR